MKKKRFVLEESIESINNKKSINLITPNNLYLSFIIVPFCFRYKHKQD